MQLTESMTMPMTMPKTKMPLLAGALFTLVVACGGRSEAAEVAEVQADVMNEMAEVLEGIHDLESLQAAKPQMRALGEKLAEHTKKWQAQSVQWAMDPASAGETAAYAQQIGEANARVSAAFMRLSMNPALAQHVSELAEAMGDAMQQGLQGGKR